MSKESKNPIQCNKLSQEFSKSQGNFSNNSIQDSFHKPSKFVSLSVKSFFNVKKSNSFRTCLYSHSNVMLSKCLQNEAGTFSLKSVFTTHDNFIHHCRQDRTRVIYFGINGVSWNSSMRYY